MLMNGTTVATIAAIAGFDNFSESLRHDSKGDNSVEKSKDVSQTFEDEDSSSTQGIWQNAQVNSANVQDI